MYFNDFYVMVTSYVCLLLKKVGKKTLLISFKSCKNEQQKRKYMNCILNLDLFLTTLSTPSISTFQITTTKTFRPLQDYIFPNQFLWLLKSDKSGYFGSCTIRPKINDCSNPYLLKIYLCPTQKEPPKPQGISYLKRGKRGGRDIG